VLGDHGPHRPRLTSNGHPKRIAAKLPCARGQEPGHNGIRGRVLEKLSSRNRGHSRLLTQEVGLGLRQIARSCSIGLGTAHEYLQRAEAAEITWPLGPEWDDNRLEAALFGGPPRSRTTVLPMPECAELHRQPTPSPPGQRQAPLSGSPAKRISEKKL